MPVQSAYAAMTSANRCEVLAHLLGWINVMLERRGLRAGTTRLHEIYVTWLLSGSIYDSPSTISSRQ
jgi:hypothetical protein